MELQYSESNRLFEQKAEELGLKDSDRKLAFVFWSAFQKAVIAKRQGHNDPDEIRDEVLSKGFKELGVSFSKIKINSDKGPVQFYTVTFKGDQLISSGSTNYIYRPEVDTPNLSKINNKPTYEVKISLSALSQKIISGAASIHGEIGRGMRGDLLKSSATMNDHFIQAILSVSDKKNKKVFGLF